MRFQSHQSLLTGYLYPSDSPKSPTLIFTHEFMGRGDIWDIGSILSNNGINVFMFDFRGCFQSEGKQSLMNSQEDIEAAINFLSSKEIVSRYDIDTSNFILGGYSYGGHMSMLYAIYHLEIKRVISISGGDLGILAEIFKSNSDLRKSYSNFFQTLKKPEGLVDFQYADPIEELLENQEYFYILKKADKFAGTDVLLIGGKDDSTVSIEDYMLPLYRALEKNKEQNAKFIIYQTGHSYINVQENLIKDIENWIKNKK
ncbi:MAG: alpha/beta fold hydrolase [Ignavibacteria bacterium]|nr:alpha/beta fold hydrolase [Ignavibacteria bacterium]